jgi:hypothetical protein
LQAFVDDDLLAAATRHAEAAGYVNHEFGDLTLVLRRAGADRVRGAGLLAS